MIEVTFNGVKLSKYIRVTEVIRQIGNNRELTLSENLSIGATVKKMRRNVKEHISNSTSKQKMLENVKN